MMNRTLSLKIGSLFQNGALLNYPSILKDGNTVAWYDSKDLSTITKDVSNLVGRWNDKLGSGHDLIQTVASKQPVVNSEGVSFNGIDNFLSTTDITFTQPQFVYIVMRQITWNDTNYILSGGSGLLMGLRGVSPEIKISGGTWSAGNPNLSVGKLGIIRALYNGASSKLQIDATAPITGSIGTGSASNIYLGISHLQSSPAKIIVKEVIFRNSVDNADTEDVIFQYLGKKYGLIKPVNFGFAWISDPQFGLIGSLTKLQLSSLFTNINTRQLNGFTSILPSFLISTGDNVDDGSNTAQVSDLADSLTSLMIPSYLLRGNHDGQNYAQHFILDQGNVRFIAFYANYAAPGATISIDELEWLETSILTSEGKKIVLLSHYPIEDTMVGKITTGRSELLALCVKYGVKIYLSGHEHSLFASYVIGEVTNVNCPITASGFVMCSVSNSVMSFQQHASITPFYAIGEKIDVII
jgi:hypothetical protein